jgi:NAD(P)-dependent dehydrogenase (short-subunit alcohol dehydrogenase family)
LSKRLTGRRCLITGAAGGQGRAVSRRFAAEGARVAVTDLAGEQVSALADELRDTGADAIGVAADVRDEAQVAAAVAAAAEAFGGLDVLYNNAGVLRPEEDAPVERLERAVWDDVLAVNTTSVFLFCKHAVPHLLDAAPGSVILNVGSVASYAGDTEFHAYAASKGALIALTASLAQRYGHQGLRANLICPGFVETPMVSRWLGDDAAMAAITASTALRRFGQPEEIAAYAVFLASEEASFVTSSLVTVHGGLVK